MASIDGIRLDRFEVGRQYEVGNSIAALLLAERWAEPVDLSDEKPPPSLVIEPMPTRVKRPSSTHDPFNLIREPQSSLATAADRGRRSRKRR